MHVGGLVLVLAVLGAILALDRSGDRQKQAQLLVSQIESRLSLVQNLPWDADPEAANVPDDEVRAALAAESARVHADMLELADIDSDLSGLLALQLENTAILERQVREVEAGHEIKSNEIADEAFVVFTEIRRELAPAAERFSASAERTKRYTLVGSLHSCSPSTLRSRSHSPCSGGRNGRRRHRASASSRRRRWRRSDSSPAASRTTSTTSCSAIRGFTELAQYRSTRVSRRTTTSARRSQPPIVRRC